MDFSDQVPCSTVPCVVGRLLAYGCDSRVLVRDSDTLDVLAEFECECAVASVRLSPDCGFLLVQFRRSAALEVFDLDPQSDWHCRLDEGAAGVSYVRWAPGSRHLFTVSDFSLRTTAWSLADGSSVSLPRLKHGLQGRGLCASPDGRLLALLERAEHRDHLSLVSTSTWQTEVRFATATEDAADVCFCAQGDALCVWDGASVALHALDGALLGRYADGSATGVHSCCWGAQEASLAAVTSWDTALALLEPHALAPAALLQQPLHIRGPPSCVVYREESCGGTEGAQGAPPVHYAVSPLPVTLARHPVDKPGGASRGAMLAWSPDGSLLAARSTVVPTTVYLWDAERLALMVVLNHTQQVRAMEWQPGAGAPRLAISTGERCRACFYRSAPACAHARASDRRRAQRLHVVSQRRKYHLGAAG